MTYEPRLLVYFPVRFRVITGLHLLTDVHAYPAERRAKSHPIALVPLGDAHEHQSPYVPGP
jgi:hypothetical protein